MNFSRDSGLPPSYSLDPIVLSLFFVQPFVSLAVSRCRLVLKRTPCKHISDAEEAVSMSRVIETLTKTGTK